MPGLQTVQQPHPSSWPGSLEPESPGLGGQGGAGQGGASPHPFPCSVSTTGPGGRGTSSRFPGAGPSQSIHPWATEAQDLFGTKALDLKSAILRSPKDLLVIGSVRPTKWKLHVANLKDLDLFCFISCSHIFICIIFCILF